MQESQMFVVRTEEISLPKEQADDFSSSCAMLMVLHQSETEYMLWFKRKGCLFLLKMFRKCFLEALSTCSLQDCVEL